MELRQLKAYIKTNDLDDRWWVAVDGHVADALFSLEEIVEKFKDKPIAVLHESKSDSESPLWVQFDWEKKRSIDPNKAIEEAYLKGVPQAVRQQFDRIEQDMSEIRNQLVVVCEFMQDLHGLIHDKDQVKQKLNDIQKRENFIEQTETSLMSKFQQLEEREAQLQQSIEEISQNESDNGEKFINFA